jgi:hypothetical protein
MNNPEQLCSICDSPAVSSEDMQCGALTSSPNYPGEGYKVVLCDGCFMRCLANLRRDRLVHTMFHEVAENLDNFARVPARDLSSENEAALEALLDALARDIEAHPQLLVPIATELLTRIKVLVEECDVDLSAQLPPDQ